MLKSKWVSEDMRPPITTDAALAEKLMTACPGLVKNHYAFDSVRTNLQNGEKVFKEPLQLGTANVFDMFGFSMLHGNLKTALTQPDAMVIGQKMAQKYFGKTDVLNQSFEIPDGKAGMQLPLYVSFKIPKEIQAEAIACLAAGWKKQFPDMSHTGSIVV